MCECTGRRLFGAPAVHEDVGTTCSCVHAPSPPPPPSPPSPPPSPSPSPPASPPFDPNVVFDGYSSGTATSPAAGQVVGPGSTTSPSIMFSSTTITSLSGTLRGAAITCQTGTSWAMGLTSHTPTSSEGWPLLVATNANRDSFGYHGVRMTAHGGNAGHLYPLDHIGGGAWEWVAPYSAANEHVQWDGKTCEIRILSTGYVNFVCGGTIFGETTAATYAKTLSNFPYYLGVYVDYGPGCDSVTWLTADDAASW